MLAGIFAGAAKLLIGFGILIGVVAVVGVVAFVKASRTSPKD